MKISKLCKIAEKNSKFVVLLGLFVAIVGTAFSIDKSFDIYYLNQSLQEKDNEIKMLQTEVNYLNDKVSQIAEDYNRSSKQWNSEKRKLLEGIIENNKNESK